MSNNIKIKLHELTQKNACAQYFSWLNDTQVNRYLEVRHSVHTQESCNEFILDCANREDVVLLGIFLDETDKHIGNIKIGPIDSLNKFAEIGMLIGEKSLWGKGIGTEAIRQAIVYAQRQLAIETLYCSVCEPNIGSSRAFIKSGFCLSGRIPRRWKVGDEEYMDDILYTYSSNADAPKGKSVHLYGGGEILEECYKLLLDSDETVNVFLVTSERLFSGFSPSFKQQIGKRIHIINTPEDYEALIESGGGPELVISCGPDTGYFPKLISSCNRGVFSLHPVADMGYLGGAHHTWQLLNTEPGSGFIVQKMVSTDERDGIVVNRSFVSITQFDTPETIYNASIESGKILLKDFMKKVLCDNFIDYEAEGFTKDSSVRVWPRLITPKNGWINWSWGTDEIIRFLRAFGQPYGGALTTYMGSVVRMHYIKKFNSESFHPYASGVITGVDEELDEVEVVTKDGILVVRLVFDQFVNQEELIVRPGTRLISRQVDLDAALEVPLISSKGVQS